MGITVISTPAVSATSTASIASPNAAPMVGSDGIPIDFAALLTSQIAALPQVTSNFSNTGLIREAKEDSDQDGDMIRDMLLAQDPAQTAQNVIPNISPIVENRPQIDVDRKPQPLATSPIGKFSEEKKEAGPLNASPTATPLETTPLTFNTPIKAESSLVQTSQASLTSINQKSGDVTATLAGESNTGNSTASIFASLLTNQTAQAQQTQQTTPLSTPSIATPIQDKHWAHEFSDRIVWVAKNDQQVAQINITPAQLGPVQITLNMNGDQASITFASPHAEVRKAIEDAMPNLREMLSTAGISLGQSNVGAQLQQQQRDTNPQLANGNRSTGETAILPADSRSGTLSTGLPVQRGRGLVDLFA